MHKNADSNGNLHKEIAGSARETLRFTGGSGFQIYVDLYCGAASVYLASFSFRNGESYAFFHAKYESYLKSL